MCPPKRLAVWNIGALDSFWVYLACCIGSSCVWYAILYVVVTMLIAFCLPQTLKSWHAVKFWSRKFLPVPPVKSCDVTPRSSTIPRDKLSSGVTSHRQRINFTKRYRRKSNQWCPIHIFGCRCHRGCTVIARNHIDNHSWCALFERSSYY